MTWFKAAGTCPANEGGRGSRLGGLVLDTLFPRRCLWCGRVLGFTGPCACMEKAQVHLLAEGPVDTEKEGLNSLFLDRVYALYAYEEPIKQAIWRMKFAGDAQLAEDLGLHMAWRAAFGGYGCVVPVPVSEETLDERGFNQSRLLAEPIARRQRLPIYTNVLHKVYDTGRQMELGRRQRKGNILGAYAVEWPEKIWGKDVLLVDDVITTGSTINECAKMLCAAGAKSCKAYTLACVLAKKNETQ